MKKKSITYITDQEYQAIITCLLHLFNQRKGKHLRAKIQQACVAVDVRASETKQANSIDF